jgi:hypothetical protein
VCRNPFAAGAGTGGRLYDVVPGDPDASILVYRMESLDADARMPELGTRVIDPAGIELVRAWIAGMEGDDCLAD